jgi:hypothetical protein
LINDMVQSCSCSSKWAACHAYSLLNWTECKVNVFLSARYGQ